MKHIVVLAESGTLSARQVDTICRFLDVKETFFFKDEADSSGLGRNFRDHLPRTLKLEDQTPHNPLDCLYIVINPQRPGWVQPSASAPALEVVFTKACAEVLKRLQCGEHPTVMDVLLADVGTVACADLNSIDAANRFLHLMDVGIGAARGHIEASQERFHIEEFRIDGHQQLFMLKFVQLIQPTHKAPRATQ